MDFAYDRWGMIDGVTRYSAARKIKTKEKNGCSNKDRGQRHTMDV